MLPLVRRGWGEPPPPIAHSGSDTVIALMVSHRLIRKGPLYLHGRHGEELIIRDQIDVLYYFWEELISNPYIVTIELVVL